VTVNHSDLPSDRARSGYARTGFRIPGSVERERKARLMAGESWQDNDLIFCQGDGTPYKPDAVSRRFKRLPALAGVPVIKLHEGRHSAASPARDAAVDPDIRRRTSATPTRQ
jgi:hypothetical protein